MSKELGRAIFERSKRWLLKDHPYITRPNAAHFISAEELWMKPHTTTSGNTLRWAQRTKKWVGTRQCFGVEGYPSKEIRLKHQFALFKLSYLEVNVVVLWGSIVVDNLIMPCTITSILMYDYFL
jgi:hypothetical protein